MHDALDYEDGSDKENQTGKNNEKHVSLPSGSIRRGERLLHNPFVADSSDESDTDSRAKPHGELASRMCGSKADDEASDNSSHGTQNAYERIKSQLLGDDASEDRVSKDSAPGWIGEGTVSGEDQPSSEGDTYARVKQQLLGPDSGRDFRNGNSHDVSYMVRDELSLQRQTPPRAIESLESNSGLFVSAEKASSRHPSASPPSQGRDARSRLQELVARKREERLEREKAAGRLPTDDETTDESASASAHRIKIKKTKNHVLLVDSQGDSDKEVRQKLTQQARPTRKASKKAIEEMNRETQRMSRNMQLAHQAKTKTKFSTADFFKKMNFRQHKPSEAAAVQQEPSSSTSQALSSDGERRLSNGTPPSSPPSIANTSSKPRQGPLVETTERHQSASHDESIGANQRIKNSFTRPIPSNATSNAAKHAPSDSFMSLGMTADKLSMRKFAKSAKQPAANEDSDDDLEIIGAKKPSRIRTLDSVPAQKLSTSRAIDALRALAHLNGDSRGYEMQRGSMTTTELKQSLQKRARAQAHVGRMEKIQALRDKGIVVQDEEEKEKDQMQLENMLEKARQDAEKLAKKEKEAAKKNGAQSKGETNLSDSDDEDADWQESDDDGEVEFSGSNDEHEEDEEEDDERVELDDHATKLPLDETAPENALIDGEAGEDDELDEDAEASDGDNEDSEDDAAPADPIRSRKRKAVIDSEDEDDGTGEKTQAGAGPSTPTTPAAKPAAVNAFGFLGAEPAQLGLSQLFAGTMAQTQSQGDAATSLVDTQDLPIMPSPNIAPSTLVQDSQINEHHDEDSKTTTPAPSRFSLDAQTPMLGVQTQASELVEPSQDVGFQTNYSPAKLGPVLQNQDDDYSTIETMILPRDSFAVPKKRRLLRAQKPGEPSTEQPSEVVSQKSGDQASDDNNEDGDGNIFQIMRRAAEKPAKPDEYDKKNSEAKGMVEEQAEESEDEYAGLGGASDDDSQGDVDEEMRQMINDENRESVKERELAAYHA